MEILIVRHAQAVEAGTEGASADEGRCLSPQGKRDAQIVGRALVRLGALPGKAFTSPLTRAEQTARIALAEAQCTAGIELTPGMKPGATPMGLVGLIASRALGVERVLFVGHQPDLGRFIGSLTGEERSQVMLSPGTLARVDVPKPGESWTGRLIWLFPPEALAVLTGSA